jgi:hypothetical protein
MRTPSLPRPVSFALSLAILAIPAVVAALTIATGGCGKMCGL